MNSPDVPAGRLGDLVALARMTGVRFVMYDRRLPALDAASDGAGCEYAGDGILSLRLRSKDAIRPIADLAHDAAHYAVAPAEHRNLPDFGLGGAGAMEGPHMKAVPPVADHEEELASALGVHILWRLGLRREARDVFVEHNWASGQGPRFAVRLRQALARGGFKCQ